MNRIVILLSFFVLGATQTSCENKRDKFVEDYLERLENSRKYILLVAEIMPEEQYNYKASPESLSFEENLLHIGFALDWHSQSLLGEREARDWQTDTIYKAKNKSKAEMIATVDHTFDDAIKLIQSFDTNQFNDELDYFGLTRSKQQIFMLLSDHITHHRGQMLVYLRLNGIAPPRYVLYQ